MWTIVLTWFHTRSAIPLNIYMWWIVFTTVNQLVANIKSQWTAICSKDECFIEKFWLLHFSKGASKGSKRTFASCISILPVFLTFFNKSSVWVPENMYQNEIFAKKSSNSTKLMLKITKDREYLPKFVIFSQLFQRFKIFVTFHDFCSSYCW